MPPLNPIAELPTHHVTNTPPHFGDQDLWQSDQALQEAVTREGAAWAQGKLASFGPIAGAARTFDLADQANRYGPELKSFDRYGMRINQVAFHPAYHDLMRVAIENEVPTFAWTHRGPGAHVAHAALSYMLNQAEGGVMCPMAMTYACIPVLQANANVAGDWLRLALSPSYDERDMPAKEKTGATIGMFMTEKQGGSDVRTNTTRAKLAGSIHGPGATYLLTGHKFFCSAPMSDAFLTLAYTDAGLSCFLLPRWRPDGTRNALHLQRLKDKLGNRSNASSEIELHQAHAIMLGEEGRGVRTIIDMVQGTRIYCAVSSAALMRQGLVQALHHTGHRIAFQKRLIDHPLMKNVLADLAIESEAALVLSLRVARSIDEAAQDEKAAAFARIGTAVAKYWNCKRAPGHVYEAMECHGGAGYIEESIMPRLFREAPVNSIWEGSGNVICLDVLRAITRDPLAVPALLDELRLARGGHALLDQAIADIETQVAGGTPSEDRARLLTEQLARALQGALLVRHAPAAVADAFCASRLGDRWSGAYGTLPAGTNVDAILDRARKA